MKYVRIAEDLFCDLFLYHVIGSEEPGQQIKSELEKKMDAMLRSGLDVSPIITHRLHYTDFKEGFEVMNSGKSGKVVLDWTAKKED